jgi:uncharacterized protein (TIGR02996 family)
MAKHDDLRRAMEASLAANPDDLATHRAYADLLMEQGDPRGELVSVQLALEDPGCTGEQRRALQQRERHLLDAHERAWLGGLADHLIEADVDENRKQYGYVHRWAWRRGWLDEVSRYQTNIDAARALARAGEARLLRHLSLGEVGYEYDYTPQQDDGIPKGAEEYPCLHVLRKAPFLGQLRFLRVGEEADLNEQYHNCRSSGEGLDELVAAMPRLAELHVLASEVDLDRLFALPNLTNVRTLVVYHERETYPLPALAANPALGALETIRLHPAHSFEDSYLPLEVVAPLFHSPHLRSLRHLHLHASSMGDAGVAELARSGLLSRLETLDLRLGCVTDAGARLLAAAPDIRHLQYLSLEFNQLGGEGRAALEALGLPALNLAHQDAPGSVEYLMSGDME